MTSVLRSMTGQGRAEVDGVAGSLEVEIRSVNHRGLKVIVRSSDSISFMESDIESIIRVRVQRGTVTVNLRLSPPAGASSMVVNENAIRSVAGQLREIARSMDLNPSIDFATLAALPGMIVEGTIAARFEAKRNPQPTIDMVHRGVSLALDRFVQMRQDEANAMVNVLAAETQTMEQRLARIAGRTDSVVQRYRDRLLNKIQAAMVEHNLPGEGVDVLREVQIFADRSDISEEVTRLGSHLRMFASLLTSPPATAGTESELRSEAVGRKLDFIIQEMFRETNTIGSKAGDSEIATEVVEIKCAIERMRELVQNIE